MQLQRRHRMRQLVYIARLMQRRVDRRLHLRLQVLVQGEAEGVAAVQPDPKP